MYHDYVDQGVVKYRLPDPYCTDTSGSVNAKNSNAAKKYFTWPERRMVLLSQSGCRSPWPYSTATAKLTLLDNVKLMYHGAVQGRSALFHATSYAMTIIVGYFNFVHISKNTVHYSVHEHTYPTLRSHATPSSYRIFRQTV